MFLTIFFSFWSAKNSKPGHQYFFEDFVHLAAWFSIFLTQKSA